MAIVANRLDNDIYWNNKPVANVNSLDASSSQGATAVARLKLSLYKGGGRSEKPDDILKGRELGKELESYISSFSIEEDEEMTTKLTLTLNNPDLVITNNDVISEGDACIVDIGYGQTFFNLNHRFVFVRSHPDFMRDGIPTVKYVGYDGRFAMISADFLANKRSRQLAGGALITGRRQGAGQAPSVFKVKTDAQIIDKIASHYGFSIDVDPTIGIKTRVKKKKTSDWEFVRKLAQKQNYTTWVDWDDNNQTYCIHFRKKEVKYTNGYVFHYGTPNPNQLSHIESSTDYNNTPVGTLLDLSPTIDTSRMVTDFEVLYFDRKLRQIDTQWLSQAETTLPPPPPDKDSFDVDTIYTYAGILKLQVGGRVIKTWANKPFKNKQQAKEYAFNLLNEYHSDFMTCRGVVIGTQDLRPRQIHRLTGIGRYSGDYYFTQVTHNYRNNGFYETEFVAHRILDQKLPSLIRRGQVTQKWDVPLITGD